MLGGIILLSVFAHMNFFVQDGRPFLDHDWYYFENGSLGGLTFFYNAFVLFMDTFFKSFEYNGFFLYKMMNLFFLVPLIVFVYLSVSFLYSRAYAVCAAFVIVSVPEIINVFHKSEINFLTVCVFSAVVYLYIRSDSFRNLYYSFLFSASLYLFFRHHYASLLYMSAMFPVMFAFYLCRVRKNKKTQKKIILSLLVLILGFLAVFYFDFVRCRYYLDAAFVYIEDSGGLKNFLGWGFIYTLAENIVYLYNKFGVAGFFKVKINPYLLLFVFSCFVLLADAAVRRIKKTEGKNIFNLENQFALMVMLYLVISSGSGLFSYRDIYTVSIFFAPIYVLIVMVIAGVFYRLYGKYGNSKVVKIIYGLLFSGILIYGFLSLFCSEMLVDKQDVDVDCYVAYEDNYNIAAHLDFFRQESIDVKDMVFTVAFEEYSADLIALYFLVRNNNFADMRLYAPKKDAKYVWVLSLYDPEGNYSEELIFKRFYKPSRRNTSSASLSFFKIKPFFDLLAHSLTPLSVSLPMLEEGAKKTARKEVAGKTLSLVKILPFGIKVEQIYKIRGIEKLKYLYGDSFLGKGEELATARQYLVFIYKVVGV